jgi:ActR/RegA family two-component response regulator
MSPDPETILIVDDEEPVRRTFREWLEGASLGCRILVAADAESALVQANQHSIDLAILDWNLGAGNDGLQLLEDLTVFHPNLVAILVTGYAHQATPLEAMRMGVRDYFDKNQDLNRTAFLRAVQQQLERIRPARRERQLHQSLAAFRTAVEKVLPLVQTAAALHDPVPLPAAISHLLRFLQRGTGARDSVLLVRSYQADRQPTEICRVYDSSGQPLETALAPFAQSLAGSVVSLQQPMALANLEQAGDNISLQPFERGRRSALLAPMEVGPGLQVVVELFDKDSSGAFTDADRQLTAAAADFGTEMLRQALAERQTQRVLFDAVAAALGATDSVVRTLTPPSADSPPPQEVLDTLREGFDRGDSAPTIRLAEAVRELSVRHGPAAVEHLVAVVDSLRRLLDEATGLQEARP